MWLEYLYFGGKESFMFLFPARRPPSPILGISVILFFISCALTWYQFT